MGRVASAPASRALVRRSRTLLPGQSWTAPASIVGPALVSGVAAGGCAANITSFTTGSGNFEGQSVCLSGWIPTVWASNNTFGVASAHQIGGRIYPQPAGAFAVTTTFYAAAVDDSGVTIVGMGYDTNSTTLRVARTLDFFESYLNATTANITPAAIVLNPTNRSAPCLILGNAGRIYALANVSVSGVVDQGTVGLSNTRFGRYLNGEYVIWGANGTPRGAIAVPTVPGVFTAWTTYLPDAASSAVIHDVTYVPSLGLYVAVGDSGRIYTAATLAGTWTLRTSGTAQPLRGVRFANGVLIAIGDTGAVCRSVDGITWTNPSAGATSFTRDAILYAATGGRWYIGNTAGAIYVSTDNGVNWTLQTGTISGEVRAFHVAMDRLIVISSSGGISAWPLGVSLTSATRISSAIETITTATRCDTVVFRNGSEQFRLRGGGNSATSGLAGNGGSYRSAEPTTTGQGPGIGWAGRGGVTATNGSDRLRQSDRAGQASANSPGAGGAPAFEALCDAGLVAYFVPGASGAGTGSATDGDAGGGGTIFAPGGNAGGDTSRLPGRGSASWNDGTNTYGAAGGGESVCRNPLSVTAGDVIEAAIGISNRFVAANQNLEGQCGGDGLILIEWDEAA